MTIFDEERDRAEFDKYVENLIQDLSVLPCNGSTFVMPAHNETAYVVLELTGLEITRLIGCVEYGADLLYPAASNQIYWSFVKALECSVLCDAIVAECLSSAEFVSQLITALSDAGALQQTAGSDFATSDNLSRVLVDLGECDAEDRFGACYKIVALLDTVTTDLLDVLAIYEANVDIAIELAKKIPIIGQFAATPLQVAAYMIGYVIDLYAAAYDTATHDDLACAIYCRMGESCQLTLDMVIEGYRDALTVQVSPPPIGSTDWQAVALWYYELAGSYSDTVVAGLMHWLILQVFARGSSFNASTARIMEIALSSWTPVAVPESCTCELYTHEWFGGNGQGGWVLDDANQGCTATYDSGNDRVIACCTGYPNGDVVLAMTIEATRAFDVTEIEIHYDAGGAVRAGQGSGTFMWSDDWFGNKVFDHPGDSDEVGDGVEVTYADLVGVDFDGGVAYFYFSRAVSNTSCPPESTIYLRLNYLRFTGHGSDPFA